MTINTISMSEIYQDNERVQYDGQDVKRITDLAEGVTVYSVGTIEALGNYVDVISKEPSEESAYETKIARQEVIEAWAHLNLLIQKMAWSLRIDADEAATRLLQAIKAGEPISMEGL